MDDTASWDSGIDSAQLQQGGSMDSDVEYDIEESERSGDVLNDDEEIIGQQHARVDHSELSATLRTGKILTTVGLALHAGGFAMGFLGSATSLSDDGFGYGPEYYILSYGGLVTAAVGPIFSVVGANSVHTKFRAAGLSVPQQYSGREYGAGWVFKGAAVGLSIASLAVLVNSYDQPENVGLVIVMLIGGAATQVLGEVFWMRSVIHARVFVSKAGRSLEQRTSHNLSVRPVLYSREKAGLVCTVGF